MVRSFPPTKKTFWTTVTCQHVRNLLKSMRIGFCGVMSIFSSMRYCLGEPYAYGNLWAALAFMPFGLFFDFMDGKVARWRKKSSLMGQELDSLADLVRLIPLPKPPYPWLDYSNTAFIPSLVIATPILTQMMAIDLLRSITCCSCICHWVPNASRSFVPHIFRSMWLNTPCTI